MADTDDYAALMLALLRAPLRATHARLLADAPPGPCSERVGDEGRETGAHADAPTGWLFRLERSRARGAALLVASAHVGDAPTAALQAASLLCRVAWQLRGGDAAPLAEPLAESIHALRNGLNAAVMNAALLAGHKATIDPAHHATLERIEAATARSAQELHRLVALIECVMDRDGDEGSADAID